MTFIIQYLLSWSVFLKDEKETEKIIPKVALCMCCARQLVLLEIAGSKAHRFKFCFSDNYFIQHWDRSSPREIKRKTCGVDFSSASVHYSAWSRAAVSILWMHWVHIFIKLKIDVILDTNRKHISNAVLALILYTNEGLEMMTASLSETKETGSKMRSFY